jgi:hypothetical protein
MPDKNNSMRRANHFMLKGASIDITYDSSSFAGEPTLTYRDAAASHSFSGKQIRNLNTEIGLQVTVTIDQALGTTLTLLVPIVNLKDNNKVFEITSWVITTTLNRPDSGESQLFDGALQTYRVDRLKGTAQFVWY